MAIWDSESSNYKQAGPDQYGISTDWGAKGGARRFGMQDYWRRGSRSGLFGGRKKVNKDGGNFELADDDMDNWRAMKESGGRYEVDSRSGLAGGMSQFGLGHLKETGTGRRSDLFNQYNAGYAGLGGMGDYLSSFNNSPLQNGSPFQNGFDPEAKDRKKRMDRWALETGERADTRRAMLKMRRTAKDSLSKSRDNLGSGWGY